jgi:hypothetical protein
MKWLAKNLLLDHKICTIKNFRQGLYKKVISGVYDPIPAIYSQNLNLMIA